MTGDEMFVIDTRTMERVRGKELTDPFDSLECCMAFQCRDMATDRRDAWIYGIVLGWEESVEELKKIHGWTDLDLSRLEKLHTNFKNAHELWKRYEQTADSEMSGRE